MTNQIKNKKDNQQANIDNQQTKADQPQLIQDKVLPIIKYLAIAAFDTVVSYSVYGLLLFLRAHYLVGSVAGFVVSTFCAFLLNTKFVFTPRGKKPEYTWKGLVKTYCTYGFTGVVTYNLLLMFWIEVVHLPKMVAPIVSTAINFPINFCMNKFWTFNNTSGRI